METKLCSKCGEKKLATEFFRSGKHPSGKPKYRGDCKSCSAQDTADWREKNRSHYNNYVAAWRAKNPEKQHSTEIKRNYGISGAEYARMLLEQKEECKICRTKHKPTIRRGRLFVDHCHATEKVRGLLCQNCNMILGHADDNVDILLAAVDYLRSL